MTLKIKITEGPIQVNNKYMIIDKNTGEVLQLDFEKPKPVIVLYEENYFFAERTRCKISCVPRRA